MSLVTRCPTCATTFKVVRDQLRISDGWVRCGRCSEVFDAMLDLQELSEAVPAAEAAPPAPFQEPAPDEQAAATPPADSDSKEVPPPAPELAPVPNDGGSSTSSGIFLFNPDDFAAEVPQPPLVVPVRASFPPFPQIDLSLPARPSFANPSPDPAPEDHDSAQLQKALRRARVRAAKIARARAREAQKAGVKARETAPLMLSASESDPSLPPFRPVAPRPVRLPDALEVDDVPFPSKRAWRGLGGLSSRRSLIGFAVLGVVVLILQVSRHERDLIVAREPGLQPAFAALCALTGCELSPLRQIRDITIEGASFAREKGSSDAYRLSFTLRNGASLPLAMPAIELTLLDMQERAVVRRVLVPGEFGAPPVLAANAERASSMLVTLSGPEAAAAPPVAGFRVEAMYP